MTFDPSTLTVSGQELYDGIAPIVTSDEPGLDDSDNGYAAAIFCGALATMVDPVSILVRDQPDGTPGWAILFQPNNAAYAAGEIDPGWLAWVSQFVGDSAAVTAAPTLAAKQFIVANPQNLKRGRPAAITQAVQTTLTGTKSVTLVNNPTGQGPFSLAVVTLTSETPNPTATKAAGIAATPAWIATTFSTVSTWTIANVEANYATVALVESTFPTIGAVEGDLP